LSFSISVRIVFRPSIICDFSLHKVCC
jgi:hypothetical protein